MLPCRQDTLMKLCHNAWGGGGYQPLLEIDPMPDTAWVDKNLRVDRGQGPNVKPNTTVFLKVK